ncbi:aminopeptidase 2 [Grosmannia clavigera kw1407]|uniref:Aminopeptidase n=1 Tax=Grosmannia clavigera (strain kw1407 / UAMH 11150) TaxID=655863 RepID=F0X7L7_GROCL|nr:aminopeptidase 2 [Grosmannia clavigera kw1407]EFX06492.1 aminopeptidase 2 [Grosmannia clavigera kw1407]
MADREILPGNFVPSHYQLRITDLDFVQWQYRGTVVIDGRLAETTTEVVLNAFELDIDSASLAVIDESGTTTLTRTAAISYDTERQRAVLDFGKDSVPASERASLTLAFGGRLNHDLAGFYRSQYRAAGSDKTAVAPSTPHDDEYHYMLSTQFEACDARRAFPCFDEPSLKATFDFGIEIPVDLVALSNMPVREEQATKAETKMVLFETTPVMSTYLLAWAVGDFEYVEAETQRTYSVAGSEQKQRLPVRVYTTRGLSEQGRWALQHAPAYIDFFSDRFGIDYPLPKADILAVHEFTHGAMENWGLVTYRTTAILFDEQRSEGRARNRIAYIVAHELAHQWFGNLVTMDWWDELWLNEGFATWAGWLATEALHPDWDVWAQFVNEGMAKALRLDGLRSSHPIQVPVRDALAVNQVFDAISYLKGCSVIRMLADHVGTDVFLAGVSAYLKRHRYGNAKTTDLWAALSAESGQDIDQLMTPWIARVGFPVVTVEEAREDSDGQTTLTVRQSRFLSTGDVSPDDDETVWWVPLGSGTQTAVQTKTKLALTSRQADIPVRSDFYVLNAGATGFYHTSYPPARLARLATQLDRLQTADKIAIAASAADLAFAGCASTPALLAFLDGFAAETHVRVLGQALDGLALVQDVFGSDPVIGRGLRAYVLRLIDHSLSALGWEDQTSTDSDADYGRAELRKRLLTTAIDNGHAGLTAEAVARFDAYVADPTAHPLQADHRGPVFLAAVRADPVRTVPLLMTESRSSTAPDGREVAVVALGQTCDPAVVADTLLPFLFSSAVPAADVHIMAAGLAAHDTTRPLLWHYIQQQWDDGGAVANRLAGNPILLDRFVGVSLARFADLADLAQIDAFFATRSTAGFDRTLAIAKEAIRARAAYRSRDETPLRDWLLAHGYA